MDTNLLFLIFVGALVGASSGYLGSFMVLKRMSLVGDALSHVALPGMAIAITLAINPMLGALIALTLAVIGIWYLGEKSEIYPEAFESIGTMDGLITIAGAIVIFWATRLISKKLLLGVISEDLATSTGVNMPQVNLIYLLLVGLAVALGVKFVGTLLMGALVIVPAVSAKNLAKSISNFQFLASILGVLSIFFGILIAKWLGISSGPPVVLVSIAFFGLSYLLKK